jgi:hypothetical protein
VEHLWRNTTWSKHNQPKIAVIWAAAAKSITVAQPKFFGANMLLSFGHRTKGFIFVLLGFGHASV